MAGTVTKSVDCGSGGYLYSAVTTDYWQDHTHDGITQHLYWDTAPIARRYTISWDFHTGTQSVTLSGPNLTSPSVVCPI